MKAVRYRATLEMHSLQVIAEDSFTDGRLDDSSDSAPGGCSCGALHGQDTLTYFYFEPHTAATMGWRNNQTGCVATVPSPPRREPESEPSTRWRLATACGDHVPAAAGGEALGAIDLVDDESADDLSGDEQPVEMTKVARRKREAVSRRHLLTHMPKNPYCPICTWAKTLRQQQRKKSNKAYV